MLIDQHLSHPDFAERHAMRVHAPPERAYAAARRLDLSGSLLVRTLFALRSVPALLTRKSGPREGALGMTTEGLLRTRYLQLTREIYEHKSAIRRHRELLQAAASERARLQVESALRGITLTGTGDVHSHADRRS